MFGTSMIRYRQQSHAAADIWTLTSDTGFGNCATGLGSSSRDLVFFEVALLDLELASLDELEFGELDRARGVWPSPRSTDEDNARPFTVGDGGMPEEDDLMTISLEIPFCFDQPWSIIPLSHALPSDLVSSCSTAFRANVVMMELHIDGDNILCQGKHRHKNNHQQPSVKLNKHFVPPKHTISLWYMK